MVVLVSNNTYAYKSVKYGDLNLFLKWINYVPFYELDIETNMCEDITEREIYVVSFGYKGNCFVLDVNSFTKEQIEIVKNVLKENKEKIIHYALFEYSVIKYCWGIDLTNMYCTYTVEAILTNDGSDPEKNLAYLAKKYLNVTLDKTLQTSFDGGQMSEAQIHYAAEDVKYLTHIRRFQITQIKTGPFTEDCVALNNEFNRVAGDVLVNGMILDTNRWLENIEWAQELVTVAKQKLDEYVLSTKKEELINLSFYSPVDQFTFKKNSLKVRDVLFEQIVQKPYKEAKKENHKLCRLYDKKDVLYENFFVHLATIIDKHSKLREIFIENNWIIPRNTLNLNWDSTQQRLEVFKLYYPGIENTNKQTLSRLTDEFVKVYDEYISTTKLISSYGEKFLKHVSPDGKVRPKRFNTMVSTGRMSISEPAMQTIPANKLPEGHQHRYRNCFLPTLGKFVSSDFASQELVIVAYITKDPVWNDALLHGKDLHSVCADLVFKDEWKQAAEKDCAYYKNYEKCSCKKHKKLRTAVKTINFGLIYGMSAFKLSDTLQCSLKEAEDLIQEYFNAFPSIGKALEAMSSMAIKRGYSTTLPPFKTIRAYSKIEEGWNMYSISGNKALLSSIERAGKNQPVQGTGSDMAKLAGCFIKWDIEKNNLPVKIAMFVHDQIDTDCSPEYADTWKDRLTMWMELAAKYIIPTGLLKAETNVTDVWSK